MNPYRDASQVIFSALARALAPRLPLTVSQWADKERRLSSKGSAEPGPWRTSRNPPLREPMDRLSARSSAKQIVLKFPIQFGKTEVAINATGYTMDHNPGPIMVCLPGEASMNKWVAQKLNPMLEETACVRAKLASIVLIQQSRSPGHDDQAAAFRDAPASASSSLGAGEAPSGTPSSTPFSAHDASQADKIGNSFQAARAVGERYKAMTLKRDYEISTGELVRAADVRHATSRAAVVLRTGLESLAITLYSATRGVDDEAKFSAIVTEIIEYQLTALSSEFATLAEART